MKLGIDFGTTRTVVACADRGNYPIVSFLDEAGDAHDAFPSVVAERDGELVFGFDALAAAKERSVTAVRSFKRLLAEAHAARGKGVPIGETTLPIDELVARFLEALKAALLERSNLELGLDSLDEGALRSVIAVPANASGAQRFVTLDAFRRAGFDPVAMLNEPSAAGFEYTHRHRATITSRRDHVVVYDLGGGTFDASLVRMSGKSHDVLATAGESRLGGDDFDAVLVALVLARAGVARSSLSPEAAARLVDQCRDAKERLNPSSRKITIDLDGDKEVILPVAEFYEACTPLVDRTVETMAPLMDRIEDELAGIYVVGGASELPIVGRALRQRFGRRLHRSPYPSAAIAIGLAIACDESSGYELSDRYSRTFGVFRESHGGKGVSFDPIFTRETSLPTRGAPLRRRRDYRAAHNVGHFRFLECDAVTEDGRPRGDMMVSGDVLFPFSAELGDARPEDLAAVPIERLPTGGPRIEEEYALDEQGLVRVTIKNLDSGHERIFHVGAA